MWSFLFSLILFVVVIVTCLGLFFSSNESCSMGFFSRAQFMALTHLLFEDPSQRFSTGKSRSVAGSSKHITLQEVQFFTTWIPKSTLLDTPILRDSDRLTERPWVLTIYINHSGGNLVHIHKHSDAWWLNDPLQSMFRWFEYTEWRKPLISYPDPLREKQSEIWVRD